MKNWILAIVIMTGAALMVIGAILISGTPFPQSGREIIGYTLLLVPIFVFAIAAVRAALKEFDD